MWVVGCEEDVKTFSKDGIEFREARIIGGKELRAIGGLGYLTMRMEEQNNCLVMRDGG